MGPKRGVAMPLYVAIVSLPRGGASSFCDAKLVTFFEVCKCCGVFFLFFCGDDGRERGGGK